MANVTHYCHFSYSIVKFAVSNKETLRLNPLLKAMTSLSNVPISKSKKKKLSYVSCALSNRDHLLILIKNALSNLQLHTVKYKSAFSIFAIS